MSAENPSEYATSASAVQTTPSFPTTSSFQTTLSRRIVPEQAQPYRRLSYGPGEPHLRRTELAPEVEFPADAEQVLGLVHFTDFQLADLASPGRLEFLQKRDGQEGWEGMTPSYRPEEFLLHHGIEGMVRGINALVQAQPGTWDVALSTGDNSDSAQRNEVMAYLRALSGGTVEPAAGTRGFRDAPVGLEDPQYYSPEPGSEDRWKRELGFPDAPGALAAAAKPFTTQGLGLPWLTCFGNHDCLLQGRAALEKADDALLTGSAKPIELGTQLPEGPKTLAYVEDPSWASTGPTHAVEPSPERALMGKEEYVRAHLDSPGLPAGHGFTPENLEQGTTYYAYSPREGVRMLVLDTTNTAGHVDGCIEDVQFRWLESQLSEAQEADELIVLASHHGLSTLTNDYGAGDERGTLHLADDVEHLLHQYPNVVLWLSGHTHVHKVTPRPGATPEAGFWEVSTGAISEWPVQFRGVQIFRAQDAVMIRLTVVDTPVSPGFSGANDLEDLASLHRELAANDPGSVGGLFAEGSHGDRNVELKITNARS